MGSSTFTRMLLASLLSAGSVASPTSLEPRAGPQCHDFQVPITASAQNRLIYSPTHDLSTVDGVSSFLGSGAGALGQLFDFIPQTKSIPLSVRYCAPQANAKAPAGRDKHLQLLLHGIPYNKNYWQGLNYPKGSQPYDWVSYATSQGYPVLLVDNLGNGNSTTKPEPTLVVQQPLETEFIHQLIVKLRAGKVGNGVPKPTKVIFGGHSYASVLGNGLMSRYPKDLDAAILTGYSYSFAEAVPGALATIFAPASLVNPAKYGLLDPGYLTIASEEGKRNSYYAADGTFDPAFAHYDFENQDITSLGSIVTFFAGLQKATAFKGDVFALTGKQDAFFCGLGSRAIAIPDCGTQKSGTVERSSQFFPNANYKFFLIPGTSHGTDLSKQSSAGFKQAHAFLATSGY